MTDRVLAIIGLALTIFFGLAPVTWHGLPEWVVFPGLAIGVFLLGLAAGMFFTQVQPSVDTASNIPTSLRLQFYGDHKIPTEIQQENVLSWYALWSPSATVTAMDAGGQPIERAIFPKNWYLFVVFKKSTKYRQMIVSFDSSGFPPYEVKQATDRSAVVAISGDVPPGTLEIHARP